MIRLFCLILIPFQVLAETRLCRDYWKTYPIASHSSQHSNCHEIFTLQGLTVLEEENTHINQGIVDALKAGFEKAHKTYSPMGLLPPITFIFLRTSIGPEPATLATTLANQENLSESCPVFINPKGTELIGGNFEQMIAHEVFHCFQHHNLNINGNSKKSSWWIEASAEFMSSIAVPEGHLTLQHAVEYNPEKPLYNQVNPYSSAMFFNQVFSESSFNGMLKLFKTLQGEHTDHGELENQFHHFAQRLNDFKISDPGDFNYVYKELGTQGEIRIKSRVTKIHLTQNPGIIRKWKLLFPFNGLYSIKKLYGPGHMTVKKSGQWLNLPIEIEINQSQSNAIESLVTHLSSTKRKIYLEIKKL